jgi:hypothetical protein
MDKGSDSWDLKASNAARSVSLLGAGDETAMNGISSKLVAIISMTGMYEGSMSLRTGLFVLAAALGVGAVDNTTRSRCLLPLYLRHLYNNYGYYFGAP